MKLFKQALVGVAVAAAFSAPAQASTVAIADLYINSIGFGAFQNNVFVAFAPALTITGEARTGSAASSYNGVVGTGAGADSIAGFGAVNVDVKNRWRCSNPVHQRHGKQLHPAPRIAWNS